MIIKNISSRSKLRESIYSKENKQLMILYDM